MSSNTFGHFFTLTTFGESHGPALGGMIDGCPPGVKISREEIQKELDKRRPGKGTASTKRQEADAVRILSGVQDELSTGAPIGFIIENSDAKSEDYDRLKEVFRPGHADFAWQAKYGCRDHRGGGRSSARETVCRVVGGAVAKAFLAPLGLQIYAYPIEIGGIAAAPPEDLSREYLNRPFLAPQEEVVPLWEKRITETRAAGDTLGGIVELRVLGVPAGLGEPVFDKLDARLAYALMGVGAVKGVEVGAGFDAARLTGSQNNDPLTPTGFSANRAGGILGGISSGQEIVLKIAVKPIPSIGRRQKSIDLSGNPVEISIAGRHDICAIPRVVPVLEAMVWLTLADMWIMHKGRGR